MKTARQVVSDHYAASAGGDVAGMMADVAPDARWTEMAGFPYGGTYVGPAAIVDHVFSRIAAEWEGFRFDLERLIVAGDDVVAVGTYSGTQRQTSRAMRARVTHVWRVEGGRVRAFEQFADTRLVAAALPAA